MIQRQRLLDNLESAVEMLPPPQRAEALYLSKFVAACGAGLFDGALSYLWDEVISVLRRRVAGFSLEYFLETAVSDDRKREQVRSTNDLTRLEDSELIRGCETTGLISSIGFMHLDFIRNARNRASAAHPNEVELTGLLLAGWLETCVREVFAKPPEPGALEIKRLLSSLLTEQLAEDDIAPIADSVAHLPEDLAAALARRLFGMYTDSRLDAAIRNNITLIAGPVWAVTPEAIRYELGIRHETFASHGEVARRSLASQFLTLVQGMAYLPESRRSAMIKVALDALDTAHEGMNNFYNEPAHVGVLADLIPNSGRVPVGVERLYVRVLTKCRIGNGYGVSDAARPTYDKLISGWSERHMTIFVGLPKQDSEIASHLRYGSCPANFKGIAQGLSGRTGNRLILRCLDLISRTTERDLHSIAGSSEYRQALAALA